MSITEFDTITVQKFLKFAIELENTSVKQYAHFSDLTDDSETKDILDNLSDVCQKQARTIK